MLFSGKNTRTTDAIAPANGRVRVLFCDQLNIARGKYLPARVAAKGEAHFSMSTYAITYGRVLADVPGGALYEGLHDMTALFDPQCLRPSWEPDTSIALADLHVQGKPAPLSARAALKRAIADWEALGLTPMIGIESEAVVFERNRDGHLIPYNAPGAVCYGTGSLTDPAKLIDTIWAEAEGADLPVESINGEFEPPQFEFTLQYADALKACDDFFLFKNMARELANDRGYLLSFLAKPPAEVGGSGLHLNLSFRDKKGKNAFADGLNPAKLSALAKGCIGGLIQHHEALGAFLAPTVNSYERLKPANMCGYWANWGADHRGVAIRLSGGKGASARLEHRVADCAANPYLAAAALLQAARLGFTGKVSPPAAETGDGIRSVDADRHISRDLQGSLAGLAADKELSKALGEPLVSNYIGIKKAELAELDGKSREEIIRYYIDFI